MQSSPSADRHPVRQHSAGGDGPSSAGDGAPAPRLSGEAALRLAAVVAVLAAALLTACGCADHSAWLQRELRAAAARSLLFWRPAPAGHWQPLGHHRPPLAELIDQLERFPSPEEFFSRYVRPQRPVVFRGLAGVHPAYWLWTDDYLRREFGSVELDVEQKKKEDRSIGLTRMNVSEFLSVYKEKDLYVVHSIQEEMRRDLALLPSAQCGGLQRLMMDAVLWFSSGGTKSVLHYDELDNINCVLDGYKHFFLVDVDDAHHIEFDHMEGLYSSVDVTSVDMYRFPGLRDVPWYNVTLWKGDCFYLPFRWPHHVISSNSRNVAVNLWFSRLLWFNESECSDFRVSEHASLSDFDPAEDADLQRAHLVARAEDSEQLTLLAFADLYSDALPDDDEAAEAAFDQLDADGDGLLQLPEMYKFEAVKFLRLFPRYERRD
ncbi:bifunctional peptidase and (3S)-lysyl hydroxylase Jmjd7-like [Amphibalanus amphitrite]|uniref:bifunctional peptidase and (3S)-lysyl hydroxylase Jmjd7-like n=1 Tax=Amphibalanus amphitrite TaxID=1232801 RepID=UPI001C91C52C|nr:bifunctional peptidase and (3S)-lysyl hydroxylase Jmjd7-like [Amphibalanus amphitrite]